MREDFLNVASHELKTPLTSLKLQVELISKMTQLPNPSAVSPEKLKILAEDADRQITRMTELIDTMLEASGMRAGNLVLHPETFDLVELVRDEIVAFQKEPSHSHLQLSLIADGTLTGHWDRLRIQQVIRSLLVNAATYGLNRPIVVRVATHRGKVRVSIHDYGMGISRQDQQRIFAIFERAVPASSFGGLGLGLYIAHRVARAHRGNLKVESRLGEGSIFTLVLPRAA